MKGGKINITMKNKIGVIIFISLFLVSFVHAGTSDAGVEYDNELTGQFLVSHWVHVTVDILDISNITIPNRNSPDFEQTLQKRNTIMIEQTDAVLSTLSEEEVQLKSKSEFGGSFSGNITKEGFDKLLNDERVRKIYAQKIGSVDSIDAGTVTKNIFIYLVPIILIILILVIFLIKRKRKNHAQK